MRTIVLLALTLLTSCCDYMVEYDATRSKYYVYECVMGEPMVVTIGPGSFDRKEDAENAVRKIRKEKSKQSRFTTVD